MACTRVHTWIHIFLLMYVPYFTGSGNVEAPCMWRITFYIFVRSSESLLNISTLTNREGMGSDITGADAAVHV